MKTIQAIKFDTVKAKNEALKLVGIGSMFSVGSDSKTVKGEKLGFNTAILYMLPDFEICPASKKAGCFDVCLVSAGRGKFNSVKTARHNKTELFKTDKGLFFGALIVEIEKLQKKFGKTLAIRLNGTSDIRFEEFLISYNGKEENIFNHFPNVQFYDYTKLPKRINMFLPDNYDLTLSYSGARPSYSKEVLETVKDTGVRFAVVFDSKELPETYKGFPVVNGDDTDLRFLDKNTVCVGLVAKGEAKKDQSGFVVKVAGKNLINIS